MTLKDLYSFSTLLSFLNCLFIQNQIFPKILGKVLDVYTCICAHRQTWADVFVHVYVRERKEASVHSHVKITWCPQARQK